MPTQSSSSAFKSSVRASLIVGGGQIINYGIIVVRQKVVAVFLGPTGLGVIALLTAAIDFFSALFRLGINESGVREISAANSRKGSSDEMAQSILALSILAALLAGLVVYACRGYVSLLLFGNADYAISVGITAGAVSASVVTSCLMGILQGNRDITAFTWATILSTLFGSLGAITIYIYFGVPGIPFAILASAVISLVFTALFSIKYVSRRLRSLKSLGADARLLLSLGVAMMYGALLSAVSLLVIRAHIIQDGGVADGGLYQAAWALAGIFSGFILGAMSTDFYPMLVEHVDENDRVNEIVNQQIQLGALIALPGTAMLIIFSEVFLEILFSREFLQSSTLLMFILVGTYTQIVSFPLGYVQRAKSAARLILLSQTHLHGLHTLCAIILINRYGLDGASWAFAATSIVHLGVVYLIAKKLCNFSFSKKSATVLLFGLSAVVLSFFVTLVEHSYNTLILQVVVLICVAIASACFLARRLSSDGSIATFFKSIISTAKHKTGFHS